MSYNPVRAASFYKNRGKGVRHPQNPHAGIKHSDIMRRQGLGVTVPMASRTMTPHGLAATLMESEAFVVRSEVIAAGNSLGRGLNSKQDRLMIVRVGSLFVETTDEVSQQAIMHRLQTGAHVKLTKGLIHKIATSGTEDAEVLFVEEPGYQEGFEYIERPELKGMHAEAVLAGHTPDAATQITARRHDQTVAKSQATQAAVKRGRRRVARTAAGPTPASSGQAAGSAIGRNASTNPNSGNVEGVNPQPMGAGAYGGEE